LDHRLYRRQSPHLLIAEVNGSTERIEVRGLDAETTEANTWLLAAAPDLLAALEGILARVETLNLFTEDAEDAKVVEQARAASPKRPETLHYKGDGVFMVSGKTISRRSQPIHR
jgi:hypothetical protein